MVQRVTYGAFHGIREGQLLATASRVVGHATRGPHPRRAFRDWLKDEQLWDKEHTPDALAVLDIELGAQVVAGPWASAFSACEDEAASKAKLFERLTGENTLLVKYVLEALDVDAGGRLHSTHELHRMLSSYVYPGEPIKLVPFQHWIGWMVACGRIKLIGIRWGLTPEGKEAVPRLRMVDADEFLEDEAAEAAPSGGASSGGASSGGAPPGGASSSAPSSPAPSPRPAADAVVQAAGLAEKRAGATRHVPASTARSAPAPAAAPRAAAPSPDAPDLPPEAPPVDDATFARYEAALAADEPPAAPRSRQPARSAPAPAAPARQATAGAPPNDPLLALLAGEAQPGVDAALGLLDAFADDHRLDTTPWLVRHGVPTAWASAEPTRHLFVAALLARLHAVDRSGGLADLLFERAGGLEPVADLAKRPEALAELVVRWGLARHDPRENGLRACLFDAIVGGRTLVAQPDLPARLAEAERPETLIASLLQGVLRAAPPEAPFWLVRAYTRGGLWSHDAATGVAAVPAADVRLLAYRLGLLSSHYCRGTGEWIAAAGALARVVDPGRPAAWALEAVAPGMALRFEPARVVWP